MRTLANIPRQIYFSNTGNSESLVSAPRQLISKYRKFFISSQKYSDMQILQGVTCVIAITIFTFRCLPRFLSALRRSYRRVSHYRPFCFILIHSICIIIFFSQLNHRDKYFWYFWLAWWLTDAWDAAFDRIPSPFWVRSV